GPNRDATLAPRVIARRGVQFNGEYRYLNPSYRGEAHLEWLPDDHAFGDERHAYFLKHAQTLPYGWVGLVNLQRVSDDKYFTDLSTKVALTSQVLLPNEFTLAKSGTWASGTGAWGFSTFVQRWQTLQVDPLAPVTPPYNRQPQLTFTAVRPDFYHMD